MKLNSTQFVIINILILILGMIFAFSIINPKPQIEPSTITGTVNLNKIIIQNILFAIAIILGAFTFNILTACLCLYNGLIFGMYLKSTILNLGYGKAALIFLPHLVFEFFWLILCLKVSHLIFFNFKKYVYDSNRLSRFGIFLLTLKNKLILIITVVLIGCFVEYFITFKLLAK